MTHVCVPIFVRSIEQGLRDAALAAEAGADMVEFRVDELVDWMDELGAGSELREFEGWAEVRQLESRAVLPCILTCRPTWEGGRCGLEEEQRIEFLKSALTGEAAYIDVELQVENAGFDFTDLPRDSRPGIILSSHDFKGRPDRLYNLLAEMTASAADVNKIVWTARTVRDNIEAFEILLARQKPTIALCMGEAGIISRILAKKFGAFLTFASLVAGAETAPGQVSIDDMKRLYRWDAINPQMKVYGVVGSPVGHSMSPALHNAAFAQTNFDGVYVPLLVNEGYESFKAFMETFLAFAPLHLSGLSITIPHKENALRYLKEKGATVDPLAESIGALNTIVIDRLTPSPGTPARRELVEHPEGRGEGPSARLKGFSTDYAAILDSITDKLGIEREGLANYRVAVIGAGGTGRTAVAALAHYGATVVIYNRTFERAQALAAEFNGRTGKVVAARMEKLCDSCCQIFMNTTSIGMHPNVDASPIDGMDVKFTPDTLVFDAIYNPMKTRFLQIAEAAGARTIGGVEMFVRQAAGQFEAWTGNNAPLDLMRRVVEGRLAPARK